jgi:uncharacterized membrane protein YccC
MEGNLERIVKVAQVGGPAPGRARTEAQQGRAVRRPVSAPIRQPNAPRPSTGVDPAKPLLGPSWIPWIFAAKTTASALLALWIAFAFNLDQPKWTLLTVFIVAQPQSGLVLAKSFYRIIGTLVGAAGALLLVSLFAQERVLFLGTLAVWIGLCTFASKLARNFAAYGFVLAGYSVAIIGIPGALDPGNAFFIAQARVTEISLGIMTTAAISHLVLPTSLAQSLRQALASSRTQLAGAAVALLERRAAAALWTKLLGQVIAIENLRASAVFEDRDIRDRSDAVRRLGVAMLGVIDVAQLLGRSADWLRACPAVPVPALTGALRTAADAIALWRDGKLDAAGLRRSFVRASADLPLVRAICRQSFAPDEDVIRGAAAIGYLRDFFGTFAAFAEAHDAFLSPQPQPVRPPRFAVSNDSAGAAWAGVRAAMALVFAGTFWILADWPSGVTATIIAAVATARLATMEGGSEAATKAAFLFALATVPAFIVVEVLLADASGFEMFCLVVAPVLFFCAWLMAHPKTAGLGFLAGLYFASVATFQDRMAYDPAGLVNISLAATFAAAVAALLFAIVAPDTPEAARRRFAKAMRRAFERIAGPSPVGPTEFVTSTVEALDQLRRGLPPDGGEDVAAVDSGFALLGAGRELIGARDQGRSRRADAGIAHDIAGFLSRNERQPLDRAVSAAREASVKCLAEVRDDGLGIADARAAGREMLAFAAVADELERCRELLFDHKPQGAPIHAA